MYKVYEVKSDDTLDSIARKVGISSDSLIRINGFDDFSSGDLIVVPDNSMYFSHIVKQGDSLYDISRKYNQDLNLNVILLELGSNNNTWEEVCNTIDVLVPILKEIIYEKENI